MLSNYVLRKKDIIHGVTAGFLPSKVLVPLCQEKNVFCKSLVRKGDRVEEGQVIAESDLVFDGAKIHSPIPGIVTGMKKCQFPNGKCGGALEISLSGEFSHIGKLPKRFEWKSYNRSSLLNRINTHGVINTFSLREPFSFVSSIRAIENNSESKVFVRLYDEDLSCQTDSVLALEEFEKIMDATEILCELIGAKEVVFAYAKSNSALIEKLLEVKNSENSGFKKKTFVAINTKKFPCGTKHDIIERYKKNMQLFDSEETICKNSIFVDSVTLASFYDALVFNIPATRVNVTVLGDCLKSSAVLKVCVGTSFKKLAKDLGIARQDVGKIIVNGFQNGFSIASLETPVTKYVKSVAFISKHDIADYSAAYCTNCGKCHENCPVKIYPNAIFSNVINSIKVPNDFLKLSSLCIECGVCNSVCPVKLPLFQSVKILKEKQNE